MEKMIIYGIGLGAAAYICYIAWKAIKGNNGCGCSSGGSCCSSGSGSVCCKSKALPKSSV